MVAHWESKSICVSWLPWAPSNLSPDLLIRRPLPKWENKQKRNVRKFSNKKRNLFSLLSLSAVSFGFSRDFLASLHVPLCVLFSSWISQLFANTLVLCVCITLHRKLADTWFPLGGRGTPIFFWPSAETTRASSRFYRKLPANNFFVCVLLLWSSTVHNTLGMLLLHFVRSNSEEIKGNKINYATACPHRITRILNKNIVRTFMKIRILNLC